MLFGSETKKVVDKHEGPVGRGYNSSFTLTVLRVALVVSQPCVATGTALQIGREKDRWDRGAGKGQERDG